MFRGNPAGTGSMPGPGPVGEPRLLWRFKVGDDGVSPPVVVNGIVYVGSGDTFALDAATGQQIWRSSTTSLYWTSAAAVEGGLVFVADSSRDSLAALNAHTGAEQWVYEFSWDLNALPVLRNGIIYVGSYRPGNTICIGSCGSAGISAIDAASGTGKWFADGIQTWRTAVAIAGGLIFVVQDEGNLLALDAATGDLQWEFQITYGSSPVVADGLVYVQAGRNLHAVDAATGAERWRFVAAGETMIAHPSVADGLVYLGNDSDVLALDATNGQERWRAATQGHVGDSPAVVDGVVYVGSDDGNLYALDAGTGSRLWAFPIEGAPFTEPAVANGLVYIGGKNGFVNAVGGAESPVAATPGATILPVQEGVTAEVNADGVVLRGAPSPIAVEVAGLPKGTRLTVLGGREEREGVVWWRVQVVETGATGFVEEPFLMVVAETG